MDVTFFKAATNVRLEAEVAPAGQAQFEHKYEAITGTVPPEAYFSIVNKRGAECRIYFDSDAAVVAHIQSLGMAVDQPPKGRYAQANRVNNGEFFWSLVEAGYRLGDN